MVNMRLQSTRYGTRVLTEDVVSVDLSHRPFKLTDSAGDKHEAHSLVIATGASANFLGLESEEKYKNRGVSACAVCDGALPIFRNQNLVVVGGGDSAAEEGNYLTKFAKSLYVVHRRDTLRQPDHGQAAAEQSESGSGLEFGRRGSFGYRGKDDRRARSQHRERRLERTGAAGMFVAIGHTPNTTFLNNQLKLDAKGFIILSDPSRSTTSVEGVFAAGDVADPLYKQAITAAGMGCKAALDAERWLAASGID